MKLGAIPPALPRVLIRAEHFSASLYANSETTLLRRYKAEIILYVNVTKTATIISF